MVGDGFIAASYLLERPTLDGRRDGAEDDQAMVVFLVRRHRGMRGLFR